MSDATPRVTIESVTTQPRCPRCGEECLLTAQVPHGWDNPDGTRTQGTLPVVLCSACDANDPAAGPLITFFHVNEQITADILHEAAGLIQRWAQSIAIPAVDRQLLDAEILAWERGDL